MRLCVIAGSGDLPKNLIIEAKKKSIPILLIMITNEAEKDLFVDIDNKVELDIRSIGKAIKFLKKHQVTHLTFAGAIKRPNLSAVIPEDLEGVKLLAKILSNKFLGDDNILKCVLKFFEDKNFQILSPSELINSSSSVSAGSITTQKPSNQALQDIEIGVKALNHMSELDIGQALIVSYGKIISVEGSEGTDEMMQRSTNYIPAKKGGVLVKLPKIGQDTRVDMPAIGVKTIDIALKSNITGIAIDRNVIIVSKEDTIAHANMNNIYIYIIN